MPPIERLLQGFSSFRENYFENDNTLFEQLSREGQKPSTLLIACSDSRDRAQRQNQRPVLGRWVRLIY